ncbi:MAG: zinc ribbon domain-containing protein [Verrucomicrobia bacterium]|nr:zinc ribbon domain-containing protein [Verrucomicrobiota bacterium]
MKTLVCPHCNTQVPETASVCTGCGAEVVRGLSRGGRSLVGLLCVGVAVVIAGIMLRVLEMHKAGLHCRRRNRNTGRM